MGYVIKDLTEPAHIRIDNYQIISREKADELAGTGLVQQRLAFSIRIYPETRGEFDRFHSKHVLHRPEEREKHPETSVLVADEEFPFNDVIARRLLEQALKDAVITKKDKVVYVPVPQIVRDHKISVRTWNHDIGKLVGKPSSCCFVFRDILDVTALNKFLAIQDTISEENFRLILRLMEGWKRPDEEYAVSAVLFIGKYFVAASQKT